MKRQLKSLTMAGLKSALAGLVSKSLTPQRKLSLIMFRYGLRGIRLGERTHEMGVQKRPSSKGNLNGKQWRSRAGRNRGAFYPNTIRTPQHKQKEHVCTHTHTNSSIYKMSSEDTHIRSEDTYTPAPRQEIICYWLRLEGSKGSFSPIYGNCLITSENKYSTLSHKRLTSPLYNPGQRGCLLYICSLFKEVFIGLCIRDE